MAETLTHRFHLREDAGNHNLPFEDRPEFHSKPPYSVVGMVVHEHDRNSSLPPWVAFDGETPTANGGVDVEAIREEVRRESREQLTLELAKARTIVEQEIRAKVTEELQDTLRAQIKAEVEDALWQDLAVVVGDSDGDGDYSLDELRQMVHEKRARLVDGQDDLFQADRMDVDEGVEGPEANVPDVMDDMAPPVSNVSPPPGNQQQEQEVQVVPEVIPIAGPKRPRSTSQTSGLQTSPANKKKARAEEDSSRLSQSPPSPTQASLPDISALGLSAGRSTSCELSSSSNMFETAAPRPGAGSTL